MCGCVLYYCTIPLFVKKTISHPRQFLVVMLSSVANVVIAACSNITAAQPRNICRGPLGLVTGVVITASCLVLYNHGEGHLHLHPNFTSTFTGW